LPWAPWRRVPPILALALLAVAGCGRYPQSTLNAAGPVARLELHLFDLVLWVVGFMALLVASLVTYVLVRFRERPGDRGLPPQYEGNRRLEVAWTVGPLLLVTLLAIPTVTDTFALSRAPADSLRVRVVGHQWWWEFDYPGARVATANELHIPAGRPVDLVLDSADVIHSFWVPMLAGKEDLIPGKTNHLFLSADRPGVYEGQCAEFCGVSHANMRFLVVAQAPADFRRWIAGLQRPAGVDPTDPLAAQGRRLFQTQGCGGCHTISGTPFDGLVGPNLTGFGSRRLLAAMMPNTAANLARWLADPPAVKPGADMPNLRLTPGQIRALAAYLRGLK
jgi:cytochrome c oxidase subunit 2